MHSRFRTPWVRFVIIVALLALLIPTQLGQGIRSFATGQSPALSDASAQVVSSASLPAALALQGQTAPSQPASATQCRPLLPPKPRPYPGIGNPDSGAPLGDYGDAPDGAFPFPQSSVAVGLYPTLWHHGGAFTRNVSQDRLGPNASAEHGATDPLDPDGHPNLLFLGANPLVADLDCYDDSKPSLDLPNKNFQANVWVASTTPIRRYLNVVADINQDGAWNAPKEWVVRNCAFVVPSTFNRIMCPLINSATLTPLFTPGKIIKQGTQVCPPNVWYRILLTREPITSATPLWDGHHLLPWHGWDGHGTRAGFEVGEVEDYLCPCTTQSTPTPTATSTIGKTTPTSTPTRIIEPSLTPTATPTLKSVATATATATTCVSTSGVPCGSATATVTPTATCTPNTVPGCATATVTPTATCTPLAGATICATSTPSPTATCVSINGAVVCATSTVTITPTATCIPIQGATTCATATVTATPCTSSATQLCATVTATATCTPINGVPCTQPTQIKIPLSTDTNTNGLVVSCLTINTPADPTVAVIHDLEWLGAPWTTATTGGLPTGWNWDTTFVGGKRAFTLNGMPWPAAGKYCFQLTLPAGASLPTPLKIYASNSLGQIIGYLQ